MDNPPTAPSPDSAVTADSHMAACLTGNEAACLQLLLYNIFCICLCLLPLLSMYSSWQ